MTLRPRTVWYHEFFLFLREDEPISLSNSPRYLVSAFRKYGSIIMMRFPSPGRFLTVTKVWVDDRCRIGSGTYFQRDGVPIGTDMAT